MHIPDNIEQLHTKYQKLHLKEKDKKTKQRLLEKNIKHVYIINYNKINQCITQKEHYEINFKNQNFQT